MLLPTTTPEPVPSDATARVRRLLGEGHAADVTGLPGAARGRLVQQLLAPGPARASCVLAVATDEE
jgi:transcription-repair coupling factor (superfamily II helicase)